MGMPPSSVTADAPRAEQVPYIVTPASRPSWRSAVPTPPGRAVDEHALARFDLGRAMEHLIGSNVIQNQADRLRWVQPNRHRYQFIFRQANELRVRAMDRQRGNCLAWFNSSNTV